MSTKAIQSWDWDVRVRDRNMQKGLLGDKDLEKYLGQLPDAAEGAEVIAVDQPALDAPLNDDDESDDFAS